MEARQRRGAQIVKKGGLAKRGEHQWLVPSQTHNGKWLVDYSDETPFPVCTCPDFEANTAFCKHIFAVEIHMGRIAMSDDDIPEEKPKAKYTQDWPAYNAAQTNERDHFVRLLHDLCDGIVMPRQEGRGRPRTPLADAVFACCLKVYDGKSARLSIPHIARSKKEGHLSKVVSANTISDYMSDVTLTPLLRTLLQESASPLAGIERTFAMDATGFSTSIFDRWFDQKWGKARKRARFVKAHAVCGTRTHVVPDLIVDPGGDAAMFRPLLDITGRRFDIDAICADKAYSSKANLEAVVAAGGVPYIPFKDGTRGDKGDLWGRMYHYFLYKRDDFDAHYHARSNVEALFSMVKRKFDGNVRSKSERGQINEVYCKFLCHNIVVLVASIYELGLVPEFWKTAAPAQPAEVE